MTVEQMIVERALADAAVAAIVGTRGYETRYPQEVAYPAMLALNVDDPRDSHLRGLNNTRRAQVQIEAATQEQSGYNATDVAKDLADAIIAAITPGPFYDGSPATLQVTGIPFLSERQIYDPDDRRVVRRLIDCTVWYREL